MSTTGAAEAPSPDLVTGPDGTPRCPWANQADDYRAYHDSEWGRPVRDDGHLYERLCLEGFQSGLSWLTILRKRPAFRDAFAGFDPEVVADFTADDVDRLMSDAGIVRHRAKIESAIANARAVLDLRETEGPHWLPERLAEAATLGRAPGRPRRAAHILARSEGSTALARDLRLRGFRYLGPTTLYAAMQATGFIDDHLTGCVVPPAAEPPTVR